jgi:capsid portal protein
MVKYIGHIPAATMRVRKDRDGFVQMVADRVVFFRNFGDTETTDPVGNDPRPNEVLHIKKYSPTNTYYGIPDIIAAQQAVVGNEFSARFNLDYFENKAVPRYVIVLKGASFSDTAQANLLEFFETGLKGQNHRTLFVPLPPDDTEQKVEFEMKPIEAGTQDSSFGNYRDSNLQEILMAHRVPLSKVTSAKGVSLANARDADKTFKESVCRPEQSMLEKKLNRIIREVTEVVKLKLNELSLTDEDMLSAMDERYLRMNVMVPDDIRVRRWGWEALPGGDKVLDVMKKPEAAAEAKTQASGNRERDQQRTANATDSKGEGRNEQGAGRTQE